MFFYNSSKKRIPQDTLFVALYHTGQAAKPLLSGEPLAKVDAAPST
ncbi:hypothetical protein [Paenibacillus agaridevorans]|nr:hypothetical protein [Paenibacillus agaridevorans]